MKPKNRSPEIALKTRRLRVKTGEVATLRVSSTNCCVLGCGNNYSNTDETIKFYCFPSRPYEIGRRKSWISAVRRNRSNGNESKPWEPKSHSRICSQHFLYNKKSNHPNNPAFIPTIFPEMYKKKNADNKVKERSDRLEARNKLKKSAKINEITRDANFSDEQLNTNISSTVSKPTIFPEMYKKKNTKNKVKERFDRLEARNKLKKSAKVNQITRDANLSDEQLNTNITNTASRPEFQGNNEIASSCNRTFRNRFKSHAEKNVEPDVDQEICKGPSISADDRLSSVAGVNLILHISPLPRMDMTKLT